MVKKMSIANNKRKGNKGSELAKFLGVLRGDKEYNSITKVLRKEWVTFTKRVGK